MNFPLDGALEMAEGISPVGLGRSKKSPTKTGSPRILLVDDDPMFCLEAKKLAELNGIDLTICQNPGDLSRVWKRPQFDLAILDYFFNELTAIQVALLLGNTPVLVISNTDRHQISSEAWPIDVKEFVHKSLGADRILNRALEVSGNLSFASSFRPTPLDVLSYLVLLVGVWLVFSFTLQDNHRARLHPKPIPGHIFWDRAPERFPLEARRWG